MGRSSAQPARAGSSRRRSSLLIPALLTVTAGATWIASCFSFSLPEGAQITCSTSDNWCPSPLVCCGGERCVPPGECGCAEGVGTCAIDNAIDCERGAICSRGCWTPCESCKQACDNPDLKPCQVHGEEERWYCARNQTCLVRVIEGFVGTCHSPPEQCNGGSQLSCACLTAPFAVQPPCAPWEACNDVGYPGCVACEVAVPPADSLDGPANQGFDDGSSYGRDVAPRGEDVVLLGDDSSTPQCFASIGASSDGSACCDGWPVPALYDQASASWDCDDALMAHECAGYDEACLNDQDVQCDRGDPCVWSWWEADGLHCAETGPESPCFDTMWQCVNGTSLRSTCDCVGAACS